ncbi:hypothetical protein DASC09_040700 [Saccharomycopsis crataegensis]|uniref:TLC domain-containing protein n=1 Tax=Saccharomycopsis crataegensis TaxID=43959 RepID=A0AAV5QPA0_9ASCO|nr:hypothetical protein DASC09_040700 [Saccharomycopsis crataegensis]
MPYEDPLLDIIRFPLVDQYVAPYVKFGTLQTHIHELIFFYLFYTGIFFASHIISPLLVSAKKWDALKSKDKTYFHVHVVSMIQCLIILVLITPMFNDPVLKQDRIFGYTPYGGLIASAASGYFLWDAINAFYFIRKFGIGFAVHGVISFFVSFIAYNPFILFYAPVFLLFEISTPFLNIRWFDLKLPGVFSEKFVLINNIILIILFFVVRICWGWYWIFQLAWDFWLTHTDPRFPYLFAAVILTGNFVLDILNVYWFSLMAKIAIKTIQNMMKGQKTGLQIDEETIKGKKKED